MVARDLRREIRGPRREVDVFLSAALGRYTNEARSGGNEQGRVTWPRHMTASTAKGVDERPESSILERSPTAKGLHGSSLAAAPLRESRGPLYEATSGHLAGENTIKRVGSKRDGSFRGEIRALDGPKGTASAVEPERPTASGVEGAVSREARFLRAVAADGRTSHVAQARVLASDGHISRMAQARCALRAIIHFVSWLSLLYSLCLVLGVESCHFANLKLP